MKLKYLCMAVIVAHKKEFCILAVKTETNPMDALTLSTRNEMSLKALQYKIHSGDDFKSTCRLLAMLVNKDTKYLQLPQRLECSGKCHKFNTVSDFAQLEKLVKHIAMKATRLEQLLLQEDVLIPLADVNPIARNIFTQRICQMRNLRVLHVIPLICNSNALRLIATHMLLLTDLHVRFDFTTIGNIYPGFEAVSRLSFLKNFHFVPRLNEISLAELQLVNLCMHLMPRLETVGRSLKFFTTYKIEMLGSLSKSYHSAPALLYHDMNNTPIALEEFYTHSDYWSPPVVRLIPNLKRLHIVTDNDYIPDTLLQLSLYHGHNLQNVRAFTPNLLVLTLYDCNLSGVQHGGLLVLCPNLVELHLIDCELVAPNVASHIDLCLCSPLQMLTYRGRTNVRGCGIVSRLLNAPLLRFVGIYVPRIRLAEVKLLVRQLRLNNILQNVEFLSLKGQGMLPIVRAAQFFLPKTVKFY